MPQVQAPGQGADKEPGAIPAALGPGTVQCHVPENARSSGGLTLKPGRVIGLNFIVKALATDDGQDGEAQSAGGWAAAYELHRFYDARLVPAEK